MVAGHLREKEKRKMKKYEEGDGNEGWILRKD